jgi:hypothetical protein
MPGNVFPRSRPRSTKSEAEVTVYRALQRQLPQGWQAWHSLRLRAANGRWEGEGDFVLAIPDRGLLVLEVKGGQVELRDGHWLQNGRPMHKGPREQAQAFARNLQKIVRQRGGGDVPFGIACAFPDVEFSEGPDSGDLRGIVLGSRQLQYLAEALPVLARQLLPERPQPLSAPWTDVLHGIWGETWVPHVHLRDQVLDSEARMVALDEAQLALLDYAGANRRAVVEGGAGTGKTIVARELCLRRAREGQRALYLCFTDALAQGVDAQFRAAGLAPEQARAATVRRHACALLERAGAPVDPTRAGFWPEVAGKAVAEALPPESDLPDLVVVDEAQDLEVSDWALVQALSEGRERWLFHDPRQGFWRERHVPDAFLADAARLQLRRQQRCPEALSLFAGLYAGPGTPDAPQDLGFLRGLPRDAGSPLRIRSGPADALEARLQETLDSLIRAGARPADIAVLSLGGQLRSRVMQLEQLGAHRLSRADGSAAGTSVVADTFLRFKGLERPFVVLAELGEGQGRSYPTRMHIALTRAVVGATVLCSAEELAQDPRLAAAEQLLGGEGAARS